jgi:serine/threonine protein kinase
MSGNCHRCSAPLQEGAKFCLNCGAMVEVQQDAGETDKMIGKVMLGRYRIVKMLGEGGMGRVYLAEQKMGAATRKVAIKTLHPELSGDPQLVARFNRESETVIELSHPNTIQFYDFGELEDKTLFIVMEFIEGESLASLLQRGPIEATRADKLLIQICGSLHEAHVRGIVHRDLKPENILLTNRGGQSDFVKVLDFGIAKRSEAEDASKGKLTKQGMVLGTPPYMSPEQFSGQELDARSDIYSLGIMVYEMLTGRLPFEAKTPWEWATKHLTAAPEALENTPAGATVSAVRKAAIMRALAKNRDQRQATVHVFLQEFTGHQDAQAAWTMATSGVSPMPSPNTQGPPTGRTPIGTPNQIQHMTPVPSTYTSDPTMAAPQITGPCRATRRASPPYRLPTSSSTRLRLFPMVDIKRPFPANKAAALIILTPARWKRRDRRQRKTAAPASSSQSASSRSASSSVVVWAVRTG